jgi:hypothetical protein
MWWHELIVAVSIVAGGLAAVTGFGIGSLLTPMFALDMDTRLAVAAVSVPHVVGTALRFWLLSADVDTKVLWSFGLTSALGGLTGGAAQRMGEQSVAHSGPRTPAAVRGRQRSERPGASHAVSRSCRMDWRSHLGSPGWTGRQSRRPALSGVARLQSAEEELRGDRHGDRPLRRCRTDPGLSREPARGNGHCLGLHSARHNRCRGRNAPRKPAPRPHSGDLVSSSACDGACRSRFGADCDRIQPLTAPSTTFSIAARLLESLAFRFPGHDWARA